MLSMERHILKRIQTITGCLNYLMTVRDNQFIIKGVNTAITALFESEGPINNTR